MINDKILKYTQDKYPNEHALIGRSLINYYTLKIKEDKSEFEAMHQEKIYDGVMELFEILSKKIADEIDEDSDVIYESLMSIHIKT